MSARCPSPSQRALHAGLQCARAGQGEEPAGGCADLRSRGRGRARGQGERARAGVRRVAGRRLRPARDDRARQRAGDPLGAGGSRRGGAGGRRRRADPQGRERRCGAPGARRAGRRRRPCGSAAVVHDGDAARHAARRGNRRGAPAPRLPGHGHLGSGQGAARRAYAAAPAAAHRARPLPAGRPRLRPGDSGRRASRPGGRERVRGRMPAGRANSASTARP